MESLKLAESKRELEKEVHCLRDQAIRQGAALEVRAWWGTAI
jgi:hypothetical protein